MLSRSILTLCFTLLFSISTWAAPIGLAGKPTFVNPQDISEELLPQPPAKDSVQEKIDSAILVWEQSRRTDYDYLQAWASVTLDPSHFNEPLGARFEESRFPKLYGIMNTVLADARLYVDAFKAKYKRPRPYQVDPNIKPFIPEEESDTYPSGHATRGMTSALVLAEIFPDKRDALLKSGIKTGQDRVIGGVHYVSDIEASFILADALSKSIIASPVFKSQVAAAQDEIKRINQSPKITKP